MDIRKYFIVEPVNNKKKETNDSSITNYSSISVDSNKTNKTNKNSYIIYTDGSAFNNGKKNKQQYGGIGVYFENNEFEHISEKLYGKITNNIAELKACIKGIETIVYSDNYDSNRNIIIYSDSEYVIKSITKWCKSWERNDWKKYSNKRFIDIKNKDLVKELYGLYKKYDFSMKHVNSHQSEPDTSSKDYKIWYGNMMADKLAVKASKNYK